MSDSDTKARKTVGRVQRLPRAEGLPLPSYATAGAAGMDLLAAVEATLVLEPGCRVLVPTGLRIALAAGYELQIRPRSGLALKRGIILPHAPGTLVEDYRRVLRVLVTNAGQEKFVIERGIRLSQAAVSPVSKCGWEACRQLHQPERGTGGFGSTGTGMS
mgnify:CR=1 FL=1